MATDDGRAPEEPGAAPVEAFAELIPDVGYAAEIEPHFRFRYISPSVEAVLQYTPAELCADPHLGLRLLDPRDGAALAAASAADPGADVEFTVRWHAKDGGYVWSQHRCHKEIEVDGTAVLYGVARNVTVEVHAAQRLADAEEQARLVLDNTSDVLIRYAGDGTVLWASPSLRTTFGYDPDSVVGTRLRMGVPEDRERMEQAAAEAIAEHRDTARTRMHITCADGSLRWGDAISRYVWADAGTVAFSVTSIHDVTAQVAAEEALAASERQYRLLAENASDMVFRASPDAVIEWVSPSAVDLLGWAPSEMVGHPVFDFLHPEDRAAATAASVSLNRGGPAKYQARCRTADGGYRWIQSTARPIRDETGVVTGRVGSWRDIDAEVQAREALVRSERRFRLAMESAPSGFAVVDLDRRFVEVNPSLCRMLDRDVSWLHAHRVADILPPEDDRMDLGMRADLLSGRDVSVSQEHRLLRADGELLWVQHSIGLLRDESRRPLYYVSQFADVTETHKAREALRFLATHDPLTELVNRRELLRRLERIRSQRPRAGELLGILYLDLDGFKPVNDTFGHALGDEILVAVARRIKGQVRSADYVARQGGDEFVIVLPAISEPGDAQEIAEQIAAAVAEPYDVAGRRLQVTASIGVAVGRSGDDPDHLLHRADVALLRAKHTGRNRAVLFDARIDDPGTLLPRR